MIKNEIIKSVTFSHSVVALNPDGIILVNCLDNFCYDVVHIKDMLKGYEELIGNNKAPIMIIGQRYTTISAAARKFSATSEATRFSKAEAFVIHSLAQRILANFYLKMDKPLVPTTFHTSILSAEKWLKKFI